MRLLFIADFFREQLLGGGESNDNNLIHYLQSRGVEVVRRRSQEVTIKELGSFEKIIVGNFVGLHTASKEFLKNNSHYIIYEHDHKYLTSRDPSKFFNFKAPEQSIINREFYEKASCVVVLSAVCKRVLEDTIPKATVHSIGCSLWSPATLKYIKTLKDSKKTHDYCILKSNNPTKNYLKTKEFCVSKDINPLELHSNNYYEFLAMMATARSFIFLPTVLETFSRVCAEAKMLNLEVRTIKSLIGFYSEDYHHLAGDKLVNRIAEQNDRAYSYFYNLVCQ